MSERMGDGQILELAGWQLGAVTWERVFWLLGSGPTRSGGADGERSERGKRRSGDVRSIVSGRGRKGEGQMSLVHGRWLAGLGTRAVSVLGSDSV